MTIPSSVWKSLAGKRIFFGHQSVGAEILKGVQGLADQAQIQLKIIEAREMPAEGQTVLVHALMGENYHPETKLADFQKVMDQGAGGVADAAILKFCYVDIDRNTDIDGLFERYRHTLDTLSERYPNTRFIPATLPLTTIQTGPKAWVKALIGRPISGYIENRKRHEFNEKVRERYGKDGVVFDIAKSESTLPDGSRATYEFEGYRYFALYPGYTYDDGHLNEAGQLRVATAFLSTVANSLRARR